MMRPLRPLAAFIPMRQPPPWVLRVDYRALLADAKGLSSANEAPAELYNCTRHGEVDACHVRIFLHGYLFV